MKPANASSDSATGERGPGIWGEEDIVEYMPLAFGVFEMALIVRFALSFLASLALTTFVVKFTADAIVGRISPLDAFKAAALAITSVGLVVLSLLFAFRGQVVLNGRPGLLVLILLFIVFVIGFKIVLRTDFIRSAAVALLSTVVLMALFYLFWPLLFGRA